MQDLFEVDWSFVLVIVAVTLLMLFLAIRSRIIKRQRKQEEKLKAKRDYKEWLASSNMVPLDADEADRDQKGR